MKAEQYIELQKQQDKQQTAELKHLYAEYKKAAAEAKKKCAEEKIRIAEEFIEKETTKISEHICLVNRSSVSDWGTAFRIIASSKGETPKKVWNPKFFGCQGAWVRMYDCK